METSMSQLFGTTRLRVEEQSGARRKLPLSDPQLPRPLSDGFRKDYPDSIIFTPFFSDVRHLMLVGGPTAATTGAIPAHFITLVETTSVPDDADAGLSYLHLAVMAGDIPLAYEALRLGTSVHCQDISGFSPLFFGFHVLRLLRLDALNNLPARLQETQRTRVIEICLFLVAHHSDPNETHGTDMSVLNIACLVRSWELVRALLLHGAIPRVRAEIFRDHPADKIRFDGLVSELSNAVRPARICPCGSNQRLEDCHRSPQSRPKHYLCPCESRKTYAACCAKKDIEWRDAWHEEEGRLVVSRKFIRSAAIPDVGMTGLLHSMHTMDMAGVEVPETFGLDVPNEKILKVLIEKHRIDPAYVAACEKTMIAPSPVAVRVLPKPTWVRSMGRWNDAVDAYIASGVDRRAPEIIEAAAKVGVSGGPLWRRCEAPGCTEVENKDLAKPFPQCSGCNTTVYCSQSCQKSAWKGHKSACRAGEAMAQMLPSQVEYTAELKRFGGIALI
ncbi:hypothetical protein DFH06DRAFT_624075 [Mycena polygramma]|nr:hypothetical protein DFH06DRAFT_624075 [Mycena polygramma]